MSHLIDIVIDALGFFLSWRAWLCLVLGAGVAYFLWDSGLGFTVGSILGLAIGLFWEARVG